MRVFKQTAPGTPILLADLKGSGGEGAVFVHGGTAYKVYGDTDADGHFTPIAAKMINPAKVKELAVLTHPNIIKPQEILLDERYNPIGYTMRFLTDCKPIVQFFGSRSQRTYGVTLDDKVALTFNMAEIVHHVHGKDILFVDPNENNWLVDPDRRTLYAIDVDGYQTRSFPSKAILPDIRDVQTSDFNKGTDWYSIAYVLFQYWTGVGAFDCTFQKGQKDENRDDFWLKKHYHSVFDPKCSHRPFGTPEADIPQDILSWFKATFQQGVRVPLTRGQIVALDPNLIRKMSMQIIQSSTVFKVAPHTKYAFDVIGVNDNAVSIADGKGWKIRLNSITANVFLNAENHICVETDAGQVETTIYQTPNLIMSGSNLYFTIQGQVNKLVVRELPGRKILVTSVTACKTTKYSSQLFEGVVFQDMLGTYVVNLLLGDQNPQIAIPELKGHSIVSAKRDGTVLVVISSRAGRRYRYIIRFNSDFTKYIFSSTETRETEVNFVALTTGVCIMLDSDGTVKVFFSDNTRSEVKEMHDPALQGVSLYRIGAQTLFARGNELFTLSTK